MCATLSADGNGEGVSVQIPGEVALAVPEALATQGKMIGGVILLEFNRPNFGVIRCRYRPNQDHALALTECEPTAKASDLVASDAMSLKLDPSAGPMGDDVVVTACAQKVRVPKPKPDTVPPGFRKMPNGEIAPPEDRGVPVKSDSVPFAMTGELEREYRTIAADAADVKALLGDRFAYSYVETVDPPKDQERDAVHVKLWFFSHTNNTAVAVTMRNGTVQKAETSKSWPPEGREEVLAAVALARTDPGLAGKLNDLEGGAMLAQGGHDAPWLGNRVLDVRFYDASLVSKYMAIVDLTTQKVLQAGPAN